MLTAGIWASPLQCSIQYNAHWWVIRAWRIWAHPHRRPHRASALSFCFGISFVWSIYKIPVNMIDQVFVRCCLYYIISSFCCGWSFRYENKGGFYIICTYALFFSQRLRMSLSVDRCIVENWGIKLSRLIIIVCIVILMGDYFYGKWS